MNWLINQYLILKKRNEKRTCPKRIQCLTQSEGAGYCGRCDCDTYSRVVIKKIVPDFKYCPPKKLAPGVKRVKRLKKGISKFIPDWLVLICGGSYLDFSHHHIDHCKRSLYLFHWCLLTIEFDWIKTNI